MGRGSGSGMISGHIWRLATRRVPLLYTDSSRQTGARATMDRQEPGRLSSRELNDILTNQEKPSSFSKGSRSAYLLSGTTNQAVIRSLMRQPSTWKNRSLSLGLSPTSKESLNMLNLQSSMHFSIPPC